MAKAEKQIRFVIFGQGRSGSTLLKKLLQSHPDIGCDGELLRRTYWGRVPRYLFFPIWRLYPLPLFTFMAVKSGRRAYGFKLHLDHLIFPNQVLPQMHQAGWRVLNLQRRDVFSQAISYTVASTTHRWHRNQQKDHYRVNEHSKTDDNLAKSLVIQPEMVISKLEAIVTGQKHIAQIISTISHLNLTYKDDFSNASLWDQTSTRILDYLGLPNRMLTTHMVKTWDKPYSEVVANYPEILEAVLRSKFAGLIDQCGDRVPGTAEWKGNA